MADDPECNATADEPPGSGVWRYVRASRAHVVIDAAAYFELMQAALLEARQRIHLIGWDFDTRIRLGRGRRWWHGPSRRTYPARLGAFVVWLANHTAGLEVRVLKWNFGALKFIFRGSMIIDLLRWWRHPSIDFKFDSAHPLGCSHHQKIVVIDDRFAVCGGIDMTSNRWDTPDHIEDDLRRRKISGGHYDPWHDATMLLEGEVAGVLGELGRERWEQAGGSTLRACAQQLESAWPKQLKAEFIDVEVGIARTRSAWNGVGEVLEVGDLFIEHIRRAKHFIYAESQYFAAPRIAEAIAERMSEADPPEIVLINPATAEGWLEQAAMDGARIRLMNAIAETDHSRSFRIYIPHTTGGTPIYVHSKLMIVDDEIVRIGSANMNSRSLGLDSECDVFIDAARPGNAHAAPAIRRLRLSLLAEHCGRQPEEIEAGLDRYGSMSGLIDSLPPGGKRLEPFVLRPLTDAEKAVADNTLLDPESPQEFFEPFSRRRGLFRRGGILRRPK